MTDLWVCSRCTSLVPSSSRCEVCDLRAELTQARERIAEMEEALRIVAHNADDSGCHQCRDTCLRALSPNVPEREELGPRSTKIPERGHEAAPMSAGCRLCGKRLPAAIGFAETGVWLCNEGERPTCYTRWTRDGMNTNEFVTWMKVVLDGFEGEWAKESAKDPKAYPPSMPRVDWEEQFDAFVSQIKERRPRTRPFHTTPKRPKSSGKAAKARLKAHKRKVTK